MSASVVCVQVKILGSLLGTVKSNLVPVNLWPEGQSFASNMAFVQSHLLTLLSSSFPNMTETQVQRIVDKMFESVDNMTAFKNHCRDFLVQVRLPLPCWRRWRVAEFPNCDTTAWRSAVGPRACHVHTTQCLALRVPAYFMCTGSVSCSMHMI